MYYTVVITACLAVVSAQYPFPRPPKDRPAYEYEFEKYFDSKMLGNYLSQVKFADEPEQPEQPAGQTDSSPQQRSSSPRPPSYPQQPSSYPQQPPSYPQQPSSYPQQPSSYPQQPPSYPQQPSSYSQTSSYPGDSDDDQDYDYRSQGLYSPGAYQCNYATNGKKYEISGVCFAFMQCVYGQVVYVQCNDGDRFDSYTSSCVRDSRCQTACPKGWEAHPNDPTKFLLGGFEMSCPEYTYFDYKICTCQWTYLMPRRYNY